MGYRSEMQSLIYGDPDKMNVFIVKQKMLRPDMFDAFDGALKVSTRMVGHREGNMRPVKSLSIYYESTKWYTGYDEVVWWQKLCDEAANADLYYEFIRVGEDEGDVEKRSHTSDEIANFLYTSNPTITCEFDDYTIVAEAEVDTFLNTPPIGEKPDGS